MSDSDEKPIWNIPVPWPTKSGWLSAPEGDVNNPMRPLDQFTVTSTDHSKEEEEPLLHHAWGQDTLPPPDGERRVSYARGIIDPPESFPWEGWARDTLPHTMQKHLDALQAVNSQGNGALRLELIIEKFDTIVKANDPVEAQREMQQLNQQIDSVFRIHDETELGDSGSNAQFMLGVRDQDFIFEDPMMAREPLRDFFPEFSPQPHTPQVVKEYFDHVTAIIQRKKGDA